MIPSACQTLTSTSGTFSLLARGWTVRHATPAEAVPELKQMRKHCNDDLCGWWQESFLLAKKLWIDSCNIPESQARAWAAELCALHAGQVHPIPQNMPAEGAAAQYTVPRMHPGSLALTHYPYFMAQQ